MRHLGLGCILLSTALGSSAVTLGRHTGAAIIGRPLDVRVQANLAEGEDPSSLCLRTDVLYGDNTVSSTASLSLPAASSPAAGPVIRVQAGTPVDEPIVTINVRVGCNNPFVRRYVLLAELVSEPAQAPAPAPAVALVPSASMSALPPADARPATNPDARTPSVGVPTGADSGATAGTKPKRTPTADSVARGTTSVVRKPVAPTGPRLVLDPVDLNLNIDRDPVLKLSFGLLSEPATTEEARQSAAALWKAINAAPEDVLRDAQKLAVLEAEAKGLREQEARDKARLEALQAELEEASWQRYVMYGLAALLLLALLALAWLFRRRAPAASRADTSAKAWWNAGNSASKGAAAKADPELNIQQVARKVTRGNGLDLDLSAAEASPLDDYRSLTESEMDVLSGPGEPRREFAPSMIGVSRSVATEELFDVQQQADFFVSLGEFEQAINVLRGHLAESQEPSPLAYLDLFHLYHKLDRRADYDALRSEFNKVFNADAPPFEQYSAGSRGLEGYENALSRIQSLWPQPRVLDVIEQSIFREANDPDAEVFDLEAYRELLMLHAVAKEVIKRGGGDAVLPSDFQHTAIKPLKAGMVRAGAVGLAAEGEGRHTEPMDDVLPASERLGLDVDLDALSEMSAFEASLPEVPSPVQPSAKPLVTPAQMRGDDPLDNLIDFEVLDFTTPDEKPGDPGQPAKGS